jgi:hypothetical protein
VPGSPLLEPPAPPELPLEEVGSLLPLRPPEEPPGEGIADGLEADPRDEEELPLGNDEPPEEPEAPPDGIDELLPPELPGLPELPPDELGDDGAGMLDEEDCCWSGQPPIKKSAATPTPSRRPNAPVTTSRIWMFIVPPYSAEIASRHRLPP